MPCSPTDITINVPSGPTPAAIPGLGMPFAPPAPPFSLPIPTGFPEDLNFLFNTISFILPPGTLKAPLSPNFGKNVFDQILVLMDKFFPFLMLYKFFLPVLNLIICIIEVLCALLNPFKLPGALSRLFRECIPEFLAIFPIFALIIMIISLLNLLLSLLEFIALEIETLVNLLIQNINTIAQALSKHDEETVLAATNKIGLILCGFQNFFVLLSLFDVIFQIIKDMAKLIFNIPPCDSGNGSTFQCCTTDVCPSFIKNADGLKIDQLAIYNIIMR